jgi:hypothetical protein
MVVHCYSRGRWKSITYKNDLNGKFGLTPIRGAVRHIIKEYICI